MSKLSLLFLLLSMNVTAETDMPMSSPPINIDVQAMNGQTVGNVSEPIKANKTIEVSIEKNKFNFNKLNIFNGDTIQFVVYNRMNQPQTFTITDTSSSNALRTLSSSIDIDDSKWTNSITIPVAGKNEITWRFNGERFVSFLSLRSDIEHSIVIK